MSRSVPEWIGKTDDTAAPPRVRLRVWEHEKGCCYRCFRKIMVGEAWILEHIVALINGGENRESNLGLTCPNCLPYKNAEDAAIKATTYRKKSKHLGIKQKVRNPIPGSKQSKWKKKLDGTVVPR